jgi:hypothetical protein
MISCAAGLCNEDGAVPPRYYSFEKLLDAERDRSLASSLSGLWRAEGVLHRMGVIAWGKRNRACWSLCWYIWELDSPI